MTDTRLTQLFRGGSTAVPVTGTLRLVVRWDPETGWAHVAVTDSPTEGMRFAGFHRFAGGAAEAVTAELAAAGCVTAPPLRVDDHLMEIEAVLLRQGGGHG